jgi:cytochrome c peroxidase
MSAFKLISFFAFLVLIIFSACNPDEPADDGVVAMLEKDSTPYVLEIGRFPMPNLNDNPLTNAGVQLGRMLFYDQQLSANSTQSCASCHLQAFAFNDTALFSRGIRGFKGTRNAMSVFNTAWHSNGFFWDGRSVLLRHQAILPIQDPLEMDETLENVIAKLKQDPKYNVPFVKAFGSNSINIKNVSLALEQFMNSIVSNQSKYDKYLDGQVSLSDAEERGRVLFFKEFNAALPLQSGADCAHCHGGINFENDRYMNNGLDTDAEMKDIGRQEVTQKSTDKARFKVPTLRNLSYTAPYMHDGRFKTLEEVVAHYNTGIKVSSTLDPALVQTVDTGLRLTSQDIQDLIAFLKTLDDEQLIKDKRYSSPF